MEKKDGSEEQRPHKESVYQNVKRVAVICSIEGKVPLKIKQSRPTHEIFFDAKSNFFLLGRRTDFLGKLDLTGN